MTLHCWGRLVVAASFISAASLAAGHAPAAEPVDFQRDIRPILSSTCFNCHGPDEETRESGLRLDLQESARGEADSGAIAIVPGKPDESELIARISSDDEFTRMPPADFGKQLTAEQIAKFEQWIAAGGEYAPHWSFTRVEKPQPPQVKPVGEWPRNEIDQFVLRRLNEEQLTPTEQADRYTLIRRLSLDLTGLPPTPEEADAFAADTSPDAYEKVVDRLLASPGYGERWGRVWLDLARYADSAGYAQDPERVIWPYRDWVIQALNDNMPFDQFTIEQLAGDLLPNATPDQILATAFHRNTMTNSEGGTDDEEFRVAAVVDRVDTTMSVWMGLTMGCAQCHTHKYDPITHEEYFQFYAIFNNTADADRGNEAPLFDATTAYHRQQQAPLIAQIEALKKEIAEEVAKAEQPSAEPELPATGPLAARYVRVELPGDGAILSLAEVQVFAGEQNVALGGAATQSSVDYEGEAKLAIDGNTDGHFFDAQSTTHTKLGPNPWWEVDLKSTRQVDRVAIHNRTDGSGNRLANFRVVLLDDQRRPLWVTTVAAPPSPSVTLDVPSTAEALSEQDRAALAAYGRKEQPVDPNSARARLARLEEQLAKTKGTPTPIMQELPAGKRRQAHIHIRGSFLDKGQPVTAGVPAAFHPLPEGVTEPTRLDAARWLVSRDNPLTARVTVNRYWEELFGIGIVETSEDFGSQGELPSHPQLLDWLSADLMENGWDVKRLLKQIVTSATYRQSSQTSDELYERDQFNRLLARGPRFRLAAEQIRDQALATAGLLSDKMYGPSVRPPRPNLGLKSAFGGSTDWKTSDGEDRYRRGLYTSWRRTTPYPSMTTFDAPSREVCTIRRIRTNTPLQALVTLNDPVYVEASQALARRMVAEADGTPQDKALRGWRLAVTRPASDKELGRLVQLYEEAKAEYAADPEAAQQLATEPLGPLPAGLDAAELAAWTVVANVLLNLDETLARP
ncbi:MAG: DUF1553 domain-containing protein [Pirellulales bacterium]